MLPVLAIALLLQSRPAVAPSSISGVVVQNGSNEPLPNVRVSLARTDAALGAFGQMVAGDHPPADVTIPSELLAAMAEDIAGAAANGGAPPEIVAEQKAIAQLPIAEIEELVISVSGDVAVVSRSAPPIMTDSQGRFAFDNLQPGTYKLIFASNGYARQDYGQRSASGSGIPIILNAGQEKSDIVMRMSQVAAVGGRISDSSGFPIAGVPVQLFHFAYDETGQRKVQRAATTVTDDRGDYRIFHLSPGRYFLNAGNLPGQTGPTGLSTDILSLGLGPNVNSNRIPEKYTLIYYPGVDDANSAAPIDVPSGADLSGLNMSLRVQQSFRVRGSVVDSRTGQPPPSASITLSLQALDPGNFANVNTSDGTPNYNSADGTFELRNVSSGAYTISAALPNPVSSRLPPDFANMSSADQRAYIDAISGASASTPRASAAIHVVNSDVDGIQLKVSPGGSIAGRFRTDQDPSVPAPEYTFLRIQLKALDVAAPATPNGITAQSRPSGADGTFRIDNLWQGEYRLSLAGLPAGYYVKEARLGELDLLSGNLRYSGTDTRMLDIVISPRTGLVDGTVTNSQGQPVPGARVVLIPERNRDRAELFRPVTADPSGHFSIAAVAPGDYKLAAWEAIEPYAFFERELLKQADDNGKLIRVAESSKQTINVVPIP
jgi:protocatechuate 3,4-dioxygenase beta subunit